MTRVYDMPHDSPGTPGRYAVVLTGDEWDLERIHEHLRDEIRLEQHEDVWMLIADAFDRCTTPQDVHERAEAMVEALQGLDRIRLDGRRPLLLGRVIEFRPDGTRTEHVFAKAEIAVAVARAHAAGVVTYPDGTVPVAPPVPSWEPELELAASDDRVWLAFVLLAGDPSWQRLSNALDLPLSDERTDRRAGVVSRGVSSRQLGRFTSTANSAKVLGKDARHGRLDWEPPRNPMTLAEATELVRRVVDAWIEAVLAAREQEPPG